MAFDWKQYLKIAEDLITHGNGTTNVKAAYFRSSVSRAYYCVYCTARDIVKEKVGYIPKGDTHTFVIQKFQASSTSVTKKVGEELKRLHEKRRIVDYDASADIKSDFAVTALAQANNIFRLFSDKNVKIDAK